MEELHFIEKSTSMVFKGFRIKVVIRVLLIGIFMALFVFSISQDQWYMASAISAILVFAIMAELIYFIERTNREISNFLLSIRNKDFTNTYFKKEKNRSFFELHQAFNVITSELQNTRIEKEVHYQYLKMVIEHVNIALFCFGPDGEIQLINKAAKKLLRIPGLKNIHDIAKIDHKLFEIMQKPDPEKGGLVKTVIDGELLQLSLQGARFKLQGKPYTIFSLQNIKNELEEQELESWQKLIRVLTHEIMNSATPVSSLSTAINEMLLDEKGKRRDLKQIDPGDLDDMYSSLKTIEDRSKGLLEFVNSYRNLTRLPKPNFMEIYITDLLHHVETLMKPVLLKNNIQLSIKIQKDKMKLSADLEMIERVLINLVLNAVDALKNKKNPVIEILALETNRQIFIQIKDNGKGINEDTFEKIFIPFFTTKKQGSGIGLSLSRQIMRLHKGKISVTSNPGEGTIVTLAF